MVIGLQQRDEQGLDIVNDRGRAAGHGHARCSDREEEGLVHDEVRLELARLVSGDGAAHEASEGVAAGSLLGTAHARVKAALKRLDGRLAILDAGAHIDVSGEPASGLAHARELQRDVDGAALLGLLLVLGRQAELLDKEAVELRPGARGGGHELLAGLREKL